MDEATKQIVEPILKQALKPFGLTSLELADAFDHDGDPIIQVIARYRTNAPKLQPRVLLDAVNQAMTRLSERGDNRFVYVRSVYAGGRAVADDFRPPSKARRGKAVVRR